MIVRIKVNGEMRSVERISLKKEKRGLLEVSNFLLSKIMEKERENVILMLCGFKGLMNEDREEIFSDGCLILWKKMMDKDYELEEKGIVNYLRKICWNLGKRYMSKMRYDIMSLDKLMENNVRVGCEGENGLGEVFDVMEERGNDYEEKYKKLEVIWEKLSNVDRMILECYYLEGCKMEEVAKRVGYKNANSVKSKKNKILKKIIEMRKDQERVFKEHDIAA